MQVFLSWSNPRSKAIAIALRDWLPNVIQSLEPWISVDIEKGVRWSREIADKLEATSVGIFCLTPTNLIEPWILFEAGAVSKTSNSRTITFLTGVKKSDVPRPLGEFQHTDSADEDDLKLMLETINRAMLASRERPLSDEQLSKAFAKYWPDLRASIDQIVATIPEAGKPSRPMEVVLEEILELVRAQGAMLAQRPTLPELGWASWHESSNDKVVANLRRLLQSTLAASDPQRRTVLRFHTPNPAAEVHEALVSVANRFPSLEYEYDDNSGTLTVITGAGVRHRDVQEAFKPTGIELHGILTPRFKRHSDDPDSLTTE